MDESETFVSGDAVPGMTALLAGPMLAVILNFAKLDTALSAWLVHAFGMPLARGALLVENMDIASKIRRLQKLYLHLDLPVVADDLGRLKKDFDRLKDVRNTIAHATFAGRRKSDPKWAVFAPMRAAKGAGGGLEIHMIHVSQMVDAAKWADDTAEYVIKTFEKLEGPITRL